MTREQSTLIEGTEVAPLVGYLPTTEQRVGVLAEKLRQRLESFGRSKKLERRLELGEEMNRLRAKMVDVIDNVAGDNEDRTEELYAPYNDLIAGVSVALERLQIPVQPSRRWPRSSGVRTGETTLGGMRSFPYRKE